MVLKAGGFATLAHLLCQCYNILPLMRFRLNKNFTTFLIIVTLATVGGGIWLQAGRPNHQPEPRGPQIFLPQALSPLTPTARQQFKPVAQESVVRFDSSEVKQAFIKANNLASNDLKPVAGLPDTYTVARSQDKLTAAGALVAKQQKYTALLTIPNDTINSQWYTDKISAPAAWDISTGSSSIIVADIDTGFALNHEDLASRWATGGWDFVHNDNDPSAGTDNRNGIGVSHGTVTAGLIGAASNNGIGVAALNWGAKILPLQALDDNGEGTSTDVAVAIHYAVDQGAKVINMSLGAAFPDPIVKAELDYAQSHDVVVVAAAGNCGDSNFSDNGCSTQGQMVYPANYPQVLAVGATNINDVRASFSSYGPNLDVVAPGSGNIITTTWPSSNQASLYTTNIFGTSFSSPIVAGLAALYRGHKSSATANETINAITNNTDKVGGMAGQNFTNDYGFGRINALHVLNIEAPSTSPPTPTTIPTKAPTPPNPTNITLGAGDLLHKDDYLSSSDGQSVLTLQRDGNFAFYDNFKLAWETGVLGRIADRAIMQTDGNLVVYDSSNRALWNSVTDGNPGAHLAMQTDGNVAILGLAGAVLWATHTLHDTNHLNYVLSTGVGGIARLYPGQSIYTTDLRFRLVLQSDGNLVLYSPTQALWSTGTDGKQTAFLALQPDGNLVLYDRSARPLWASGTDGFGLTRLIVQPDGNLVLYDLANIPRWNTGTGASYRLL